MVQEQKFKKIKTSVRVRMSTKEWTALRLSSHGHFTFYKDKLHFRQNPPTSLTCFDTLHVKTLKFMAFFVMEKATCLLKAPTFISVNNFWGQRLQGAVPRSSLSPTCIFTLKAVLSEVILVFIDSFVNIPAQSKITLPWSFCSCANVIQFY